ncbi:hypothetical protein B0J13DRAFT_608782 [Dactylonectria estremocensis]|uniref:Nephrocystin 3-like N-terminal domain-containing protein n=1 Tax=Dactylonectria estremocensis TaxID=1079267 RepID=A0A9P9J3Z1_9HYPO|nr:hypothetical protein B0J13DRAFT_608782 [Dactylonectria estremocensis]
MDVSKNQSKQSLAFSRAETLISGENGAPFKSLCDEAIDEFLADLNPEDHKKNPFVQEVLERRKRQASESDEEEEDQIEQMQKCIEKLERQKKECRAYRILEKIGPFLDGLGKLTKTCESVLSASPFGVAIAFSGVRVVLEHAVSVQGALSEVLDALEEIAPDLKCYELIASSQQDSPDIAQAIKRAYKRILSFWCLAAGTLSKNYLKITVLTILKALKPVIQDFRDQIRQDSAKVQNMLAATRAAQDTSEQLRQLRRDIAEWIRGSKDATVLDHEADLRARRQRCTEGTCTWILEDNRFKTWRDAKHNTVLWYNAPPGTGKSIMASVVVDHLQKQPDSEVIYFFYTFSESSKRHGLGGFRSLALQLLTTFKYTPDALKWKYGQAVQQLKYELTNVDYDLIAEVLRILLDLTPQTYIVVDGLDECLKEDPMFFSTLIDLLGSRTNGTSKWFFSSCDISSMRTTMTSVGAQEIQPDFEAVSRDIHTYLKAEDICMIHSTNWIDEHEQNFLYARLRCEIVKGRGYTTREEISEALETFPKGLDSCYLKALERIAGRSVPEQNLAKRVFRILITSEKPVTVDELLNALAIHPSAKDHSSRRGPMGGFSMVEDICNPLIIKESTQDSQVVKLYHKSVKDFLLNTADKYSIDERLRGFLIDELLAEEEIGMACLTYLSYERYTKPLDLKALLSTSEMPEEHAFLRYAATFWYSHLWETKPSPAVMKVVEDFLKSPAFWTCIYVQSHVSPHLFARYNRQEGTNCRYVPTMGRMKDPSALFALPLPQWMVNWPSADSVSLDRSFCAFVQDWGELLTKSPDHLDKTVPLTLFEPGCHLTAPGKHPKVRAKYSSKVLGLTPGLLLADASFATKKGKEGRTLQLRIIREEGQVPNLKARVYKIAIFPKPKILGETLHTLPHQTGERGWLNTLVRGKRLGEDLVQAWRVDPQNLSIRRGFQGLSTEQLVPKEVSRDLGLEEQGNGFWRVVQMTIATEPNRGDASPITRLWHLRWVPLEENEDHCHVIKTKSSAISDTDSDSNTETDSDTDTDSDSDSDSGSDSDETQRDSADESDTQVDSDPGPHEPHRDCLIASSDFGVPVWRSIRTDHTLWSNLISARHPTLPIIAVSYKHGQIDVMDDSTGLSTSVEITEGESKIYPATSRELQFSPCGNYLHLLAINFSPTAVHTECSAKMWTYTFTHEAPSTYSFESYGNGPSADKTYRFAELLSTLPTPFAMAYWTAQNVVVALPPVTYNPKIARISLAIPKIPESADTQLPLAVSTLSSSIFFPSTAIFRQPHLMYCDGGSAKEDSYLYLVLDSSAIAFGGPRTKPSDGPGQGHVSEEALDPSQDKEPFTSPPAALRWKISGTGEVNEKGEDYDAEEILKERQTWRTWMDEDEISEDIRSGRTAADEVRILRGDFVGKKYNVPFRSGLDWTRQGFLSCA